MRRSILFTMGATACLLAAVSPALPNDKPDKKDDKKEEKKTVYPTALFVFEERGAGAKDMGAKVTDLLFAKLVVKDSLSLVDREDLKKTLGEAELKLSGAVKPADATKV